ncbi:hypothetical protein [Vibrio mediterranei]|uniref:hypothetical protein n=1 Tax=Vibrio mediterranei TaxID=689 RepID=UPI0040688495
MNDWVYPRTEFAERIVSDLKSDLANRLTFFAPHQHGKTHFIVNDVIPAALSANLLPIYVDFRSIADNPTEAFCRGVEMSLSAYAAALDRIENHNHLRLLENGTHWVAPNTALSARTDVSLESCFKKLNQSDTPVLLLLDEAHHLTSHHAFSAFTKALRSFMTARADNQIKAIFTGSDKTGLKRLFKNPNSAFYESSTTYPFEELGNDFVHHQLEVFKRETNGLDVDFELAMAFFIEHNKKPAPLTELLQKMASLKTANIERAAELVEQTADLAPLSVEKIMALDEPEFGILYLLAIGQNKAVTSDKGVEMLKLFNIGDTKPLTATDLSDATQRLLNNGMVITPTKGEYELSSLELRCLVFDAFKSR